MTDETRAKIKQLLESINRFYEAEHQDQISGLKNNWTATLIDRTNELLREHKICPEVENGLDCSHAITAIHGYIGRILTTTAEARKHIDDLHAAAREHHLVTSISTTGVANNSATQCNWVTTAALGDGTIWQITDKESLWHQLPSIRHDRS